MTASNGSIVTSQLPVTSNVASTDRLLLLFNAISNSSVGNGSPQTRMVAISDLTNAVGNGFINIVVNNSITIGDNIITANGFSNNPYAVYGLANSISYSIEFINIPYIPIISADGVSITITYGPSFIQTADSITATF